MCSVPTVRAKLPSCLRYAAGHTRSGILIKSVKRVILTAVLQIRRRASLGLPPAHVVMVARDLDGSSRRDVTIDVVVCAANPHKLAWPNQGHLVTVTGNID